MAGERTYRRTVTGLSAILRILVYVLLVIVLIYLGQRAYHFGYDIFHETAMEEEPGTDVIVTVPEGASPMEIAELLKNDGLISDTRLFWVQERISGYYDELGAGTFTLNTSEKPTELIEILAGEADETNSDGSDS